MQVEVYLIGVVLGVFILASLCALRTFLFHPKGDTGKHSLILAGLGAAGLAGLLVVRGVAAGRVILVEPVEVLTFYALAVTAVFLYTAVRFETRCLSVVILPYVTLVLGLAVARGRAPVPIDPPVHGLWLKAHVVTALAGYALFTLACALAVFYLLQDWNLKRKTPGRRFRSLPALETLDRLIGGQILHAFGAFSIAIGLGVVLTHVNHWRAAWLTDPKIIATAATWLVYAVLSYLRLSADRHGRKVAVITIVGFAFVLISFVGVNALATGMHRFALAGALGGGG